MNAIIKKNGVSFGVGLGVLAILLAVITYSFNMYGAWWLGILALLLYLVGFIMLLSRTKKELNGQMTFKEAFTTYFIAAVLMILISTLFNIVLYNFVDPGAKETVKEETIKTTVSFMQKMSAPADQINKAVEDIQNKDQFSISSQIMGLAIGIAVSCVFGLLLALIFKSRPTYKE
ncbi:DUF4199 domain-containing protein [Flavobacterium sp. MAH-1]|uniref:DUF4199 domain-containing protein n=1 Tax=Flavobacterium agri TaxID=2743471 RepID=A0A7Y8Y3X9_9FLAO|nr:DUF4199 domain-containing protein [Flavobacterium agri]NUY82042.1 DUF4199 domain-containing protein [Flavobacterium agri]NYA72066.1 DUF4199 domain-containing protein [Flavobacterium agri]